MSEITQIDRIVDCLNQAFANDPATVRAMLINVVPCNQLLADHPTIAVRDIDGSYFLSALGLLNGCLEAAGIPKVASKWSDQPQGKYEARKLLGFCEYIEPEVTSE